MSAGFGITAAVLAAAAAGAIALLRTSTPAIRFGVAGALGIVAAVFVWLAAAPVDPATPESQGTFAALGGENAPNAQGQAEALIDQARQAANAGRDDEARETYNRALEIYRRAGLEKGVGQVLLGIGVLDQIVGQGERARQVYAEADAVFRAAGDRFGEAQVTLALAELERAQFNNEAALTAYKKAQTLFHKEGAWSEEAQALLGRTDAERRLRMVLAARRSVARAGAIYEILDDGPGKRSVARSVEELRTYQDQNDLQREEFLLERINAQQAGDPSAEATLLLRLGDLERRAGYPVAAREAYTLALTLFAGQGDGVREAAALAGLGDVERATERFPEAASAYALALPLFQQADDPSGAGRVLVGQAALEFDRDAEGRRLYMEAQSLFETAAQPGAVGNVLLGLGELDRKGGRMDEARKNFMDAHTMFGERSNALGQARAMLALGDLDQDLGNMEDAVAGYEQALLLFHQARCRPGEAWVHLGLGVALAETQPREASVNYRLAAGVFADLGMEPRATAALTSAAQISAAALQP